MNPFAGLTLGVAAMLAMAPAAAADSGFLDRSVTVDGVSYRYQVYVPVDYTPDKLWPIALFLHGSGERGDDGLVQTQAGLGSAIRGDRKRFPMLVVMPQAQPDTRWTGAMAAQALAALDQSIKEFHGDPQRVYLTGLSMGGQGVWYIAAANPHRFAAIAPICGYVNLDAADFTDAQNRALIAQYPFIAEKDPYAAVAKRIGKTPVWIFHGAADDLVPPAESRNMAEQLRAQGDEVRFNEYPGVNHGAWDRAYAEPELIPWLLLHRLDAK